MVLSTARVDGRVEKDHNATSMKEITALTRSMASESSLGLVVTFTKESIKMMKEKAMER
jgi:hypothetical protein